MIYFRKTKEQKGSGLVEVVVAASILSVVSVAFLGAFVLLSRFHERDMLFIKGELLAEEGLEVVRLVKSADWSTLSSLPQGQDRYFSLAPSVWSITTTPEIVDGVFVRSLRLYPVSRNASDDIVSSGGTVDTNTLRAEVVVSWNWRNATSTVTYTTYVTNL